MKISSRLLKNLVFLLMLILAAAPLFAQLRIERGGAVPQEASGDVWWLDTLKREVFHHQTDGWKMVANPNIDALFSCHGYVYAMRKYGGGVEFNPATRDPTPIPITSCICWDSVVAVWYVTQAIVHDHHRKMITRMDGVSPFGQSAYPTQTVQGLSAICLPLTPRESGHLHISELRSWGMLGENGKWVIEPQFDAPFTFKNGFAEVLYYGQRRKINVSGEFVD
jgi:hypothetical protein